MIYESIADYIWAYDDGDNLDRVSAKYPDDLYNGIDMLFKNGY